MTNNREKFYTVSARLLFSSIIVVLMAPSLANLLLAINSGQAVSISGTTGAAATSVASQNQTTTYPIVGGGCLSYKCETPTYNDTGAIITIPLNQTKLSWSPLQAANVTAP